MPDPVMNLAELHEFIKTSFPQIEMYGGTYRLQQVEFAEILAHFTADENHIRPGGTISGPVMMFLVDISIYWAIFSAYGETPLAVTTSLNINFLNKPEPGTLAVRAKLLKRGKRLVVGEASIFAPSDERMVFAHATATYSIPPQG